MHAKVICVNRIRGHGVFSDVLTVRYARYPHETGSPFLDVEMNGSEDVWSSSIARLSGSPTVTVGHHRSSVVGQVKKVRKHALVSPVSSCSTKPWSSWIDPPTQI